MKSHFISFFQGIQVDVLIQSLFLIRHPLHQFLRLLHVRVVGSIDHDGVLGFHPHVLAHEVDVRLCVVAFVRLRAPAADDLSDAVDAMLLVVVAQVDECRAVAIRHSGELAEPAHLACLSQPLERLRADDVQRIVIPQSQCDFLCHVSFLQLIR